MQGFTGIIPYLNTILANELTAINQYFLHARILENWGLHKLGRYEYHESIDEMKHADAIIQRILFLDGLPNVQKLNKVMIGENVKEVLEADLKLEHIAIPDLRRAISFAEETKDYVSRDLLAGILKAEEEHVDYIETQLGLLERIGAQNYMQLQVDADKAAD